VSKQQARCEVRYNDDGSIDEVLVYDKDGSCIVHLEDMGGFFFMGVGEVAGFNVFPSHEGGNRMRAAVGWSWCNTKIEGHRPEGI